MQASLCAEQSLADLRTIVHEVFSTMVDIEITPAKDLVLEVEEPVASVLYYTEACQGAILIECDPALAFAFTSSLMSIKAPTSFDENVEDSIGELVNMIGGNLKALMPPETRLSTPVVLHRRQLDELLAASSVLRRVCFSAGVNHCCVSLLETAG